MPKKFAVSIVPRAAVELDDALTYISQYNQLAALKLAREFRRKIRGLERSPDRYAPLPEKIRGSYIY